MTEITVKKRDLLNIWNVLSKIGNAKSKCKLSYLIAKNKRLIKDEVDALVEAQNPSDEFRKYDEARVTLNKEMATKDEKGKPVFVNGEFIFEDYVKWEKKIDELKVKFSDVIKNREEQVNGYKKLLEEEFSFTPIKINMSQFPDDIIDGNDMEIILDFIE